MADEPKPTPTATKPPDVDPLTALGNAVNEMRGVIDGMTKKYDNAIAEMAKKFPAATDPGHTAPKKEDCKCSTCRAINFLTGL